MNTGRGECQSINGARQLKAHRSCMAGSLNKEMKRSQSTGLKDFFFVLILCCVIGSSNTSKPKSYYQVLNVPDDATQQQIKKAFHDLGMKLHPDKNNSPTAHQDFVEVTTAYEVLSDKRKRQIYDAYGEEGLKQYGEGGPGEMDDDGGIFNYFKFGNKGHHRGRQKAEAFIMKVYLTLEQLYTGELLFLSYNRPTVCLRSDECLLVKKSCSGPGVATVTQSFGPGFVIQNQVNDDSCIDREKSWNPNCRACPSGSTEMQLTHTSVYIDAGMRSDDVLTLEGSGNQRLGFEPGDLVLRVIQTPHKAFARHGSDLHTTVFITLLEALNGFNKSFPHINGKPLLLARDTVTHDAEVHVVKGMGMPIKDEPNKFGELLVKYKIQYPTELSKTQKEHIIAGLSGIKTWKFEQPSAA